MLRRLSSFAVIGILLLLTACGTPQERCQSSLAKEIRSLDRLISEVNGNLARGYAYETRIRNYSYGVSSCSRYHRHGGFCIGASQPRTYRARVAIDPTAERRKLANLQKRRSELALRSCPAPVAVVPS
ncbi:MAG: hypothetical protein ACPGNV_07605 [Mangrovicoccus sp.]